MKYVLFHINKFRDCSWFVIGSSVVIRNSVLLESGSREITDGL